MMSSCDASIRSGLETEMIFFTAKKNHKQDLRYILLRLNGDLSLLLLTFRNNTNQNI